MNKENFRILFERALMQAAIYAEQQLDRQISSRFIIELHGAKYRGVPLDVTSATDKLYLDEDHFYRIIDVAVIEVGEDYTKIFVRASSHHPATFDQTWNNPPGMGPFKQLRSQQIKISKN
jgi:hypothetical protein